MTYFLIAITSIISYISFKNRDLYYKLIFNPYDIVRKKQYYKIFSHAFLHADYGHLIFNMLTLYFFGRYIEKAFEFYFGNLGNIYFILLYFLGIIFSTIYSLYKHKDNPYYNAVGASGGVSAILFSYIIFDPFGKIYIFFIPIGIPSFIFGILYLVYSAYMSKKNVDNIGHDAHFWGAVFGLIFPIILDFNIFIQFLNQF